MSILETTILLILQWWWVPAPIVLFLAFSSLWLYFKRVEYIRNITWVQLRLMVPQDVLKTPLAMEQVFANLHSIQLEGTWVERNIKGKVQEWYSCELVSVGGDIFFYIRTPVQFRNLVESAIYAQYPDAEITEAEDYVFNVPDNLPSADLELFGSEFKLIKEDAYPIRTYEHFKFETEEGAGDVDPIAHLMESLGRLRAGEQIWLQFVIRPADDSWRSAGEGIIEEILGRKEKKSKGPGVASLLINEIGEFATAAPQAPFGPPTYGSAPSEGDKKDKQQKLPAMHENERVKEIVRKLSKVAFKTIIRGVYIAPREIFDVPTYFSVVGGFKQFTSYDLNGLRPAAITGGRWPFKASKSRVAKKQHLLKYRLRRAPSEEGFILNTEELATLFHFPGRVITTPSLPRVESRKGEPPSSLPVL